MIIRENYIIICELEYFSLSSLLKLFDNNHEIFYTLVDDGYIKKNQYNLYAFSYVGIITVKNQILCILPKYYREINLSFEVAIKEVVRIIKVLKKAGKIDDITPDFHNFSSKVHPYFSELILADNLIKDYLDNGIYKKEVAINDLNQQGEINWSSTIENLQPIFSKRTPIYTDVITHHQVTETFNVVTELHKWIVKFLLSKYALLLDYTFAFTEDTVSRIEDLGSLQYLNSVLSKELHEVFTDRTISVIKQILSFINQIFVAKNNNLSIFGTGYFHVIWEKTNSLVFNNQVDDFQSSIPTPDWFNGAGDFVEKETLKPDIITVSKGEETDLFIIDAKYYDIKFKAEGVLDVYGNPGIEDVTKQFLYEAAVTFYLADNVFNCFIFPRVQNPFFSIFGKVELALFPNKRILLLYLSANSIFDAYISNKKMGFHQIPIISSDIKAAYPLL